jgi:hypothetical protein
MVVKGGDVDQLLATDYAQPYVQIVRDPMYIARTVFDADLTLLTVLQCDAEQIREHCTDGARLCPSDVWHHQSGHHHLEAAMVLRSRRRPAVEPLVESRQSK